jgi:serine/threonine protein phosphatase 1
MKYAISDIHGRYDRYERLLKQINFSDEDEMFIIGDVIDRGEGGVRILKDVMHRNNVHMSMGNHELMAVDTLLAKDNETKMEKMDLWEWNGGGVTYSEMMKLDSDEYAEMVDFLVNLPASMETEVNGQKFHLVHGYPADSLEDQMWTRPNLKTPNPYTDRRLIIGHTPVMLLHEDNVIEQLKYMYDMQINKGHVKIEHAEGFIDIDCGCARNMPESRLGCLRLDDMEEFYA